MAELALAAFAFGCWEMFLKVFLEEEDCSTTSEQK